MQNIALLGAGRMARVHAAAIFNAGARLCAVYDIVPDQAERLAAETGASAEPTAEVVIGRPDVDALIIATPATTHVPYAIAAVRAGKAVMCEKPLAPSLQEAQFCVDQLGDQAANVFLAFNRRFDPGHAGAKAALDAGEIGSLEQLTITSRDPYPPSLAYIPSSGGLFRDMMIHDFDMARWFLGEEPTRIYAQGSALVDQEIRRLGDVDSASVVMMTASGRQAVIQNSRRAVYGFDQRIEAFGSLGMVISDNNPRLGVKRYGQDQFGAPQPFRSFFMERYGDSYRIEIETFLGHLQRQEPMPVNAIDGLRAAYLAEAATDSAIRGAAIDLDPSGRVTWK